MSRIAPLLCPLLVGRDDLLDLADRRIADAAAGRGQFLLLAGEAGIGKTRFFGALRRKAEAAGLECVRGDLAPQDRHVPASVVLDLARTMIRVPRFAKLGADLLAMPHGEDGSEPRTRRLLVLDMVDRIVEELDAPAMIGFEDLQWADDLSLEVVGELARRTHDRPTLLVGAYRTDELLPGSILRAWRARLVTQRLAEEARLTPLTLDQTALMTTLIIANGLPAPREVVAAVYERTDGIPLHIEELLGALGDDARADGGAIREATVPATIEDAVIARFERLSPEGRAVAQAGAVIGRCFVQDVLAGIMDAPPAELDAPLRELVDQAFLDPPGARGLYDFRHQLLRDALYRSVPASDLRRLHARVGEFGSELEGASEIHASVHFERAGMRAQAFRAALSGARVAAKLSSHREAFELYRRAVQNMPPDMDPAEQGALYEAYAAEPAAIEIHDVAEHAALTARDRFFEAGRPVDAARQLASIAGIARREAHAIEARSAPIAQGLSELEPLQKTPERELARHVLLIERAAYLIDTMDLDAAGDAVIAAVEAARAAGDPAGVIFADSIGGMADVLKGDIDKGLSRIEVAAREAREAGYEDVGVTVYRNAVTTAVRVMAYGRAGSSLRQGLRYADAIEQSHCRHVMAAVGALVEWAAGRWDDAIARGGQELANRGCGRGTLAAQVALGYVAFGRGNLDDARTLLLAAGAVGDRSGAIDLRLPAMWGLAEADLVDRSAAVALDRCEAAFVLAVEAGERALLVPFVVTGVRAALASGRPADAERWLDRVVDHLGDWGTTFGPALAHGRGLVSLAAGATGTARASLEAALRGWDGLGRVWEATWARLDLAACDLRSSRFAEAASLLADARATAARLASPPLLDRVDELTRVARGRGSLDEPWLPLTTREFEVARLIADGMTNAEIAGELSIAPKTASAHVEHILAKLGVARRAEIATWVAAVSRPAGDPSPNRQAALAQR
jgi:DNA-binding CsgD family transcriptional regulator